MQHTIPQFIEHEAKIVGPFTFKQFIFIAAAGAGATVLYFSTPFPVFLLGTAILLGVALALGLLQVEGRSLPDLIKNIFFFFSSSKIYLWKRQSFNIMKTEIKKPVKDSVQSKEGITETPRPVISKSKLNDLNMKIETKK